MASICLSTRPISKPLCLPPQLQQQKLASPSHACQCSFHSPTSFRFLPARRIISRQQLLKRRVAATGAVVCMAPDEEKLTRRNPLDFPIEWERPKPGRRPDIFPQFSPMKTPIPPPLPYDPPEEDEEEEEEEKKKEEEEVDPEKEEEPNKPDKQ